MDADKGELGAGRPRKRSSLPENSLEESSSKKPKAGLSLEQSTQGNTIIDLTNEPEEPQ